MPTDSKTTNKTENSKTAGNKKQRTITGKPAPIAEIVKEDPAPVATPAPVPEAPDPTPEAFNVALSHLKGDVEWMDIATVDFGEALNVRDPKLYQDRVARKVNELLLDKCIRTPLVACRMVDDIGPLGNPNAGLVGACGFVRSRAIAYIKEHNPEVYAAHFAMIPVMVYRDVTNRDRELLMLDHGSEEPLNEYELYGAVKRLVKAIVYSEKEIINALIRLFKQMLGVEERRTYAEKVATLNKDGAVIIGSETVSDLETLNHRFFRGRFQFYKRIVIASPQTEREYRAYVMREAGYVKITYKMAEQLAKLGVDDTADFFRRLRAERTAKNDGDKASDPRVWGAGKLAEAKKVCQSPTLKALFGAAMGEEGVADLLPILDNEQAQIDEAKEKDPDAFWAAVHAILGA